MKIDIEIGNFPFLSDTSKVAVLNYIQEDVASDDDSDHYFEMHEDDGDHEVESEDIDDDDNPGEEFDDVDDDHDDAQELSLVDASTNTTRGIYRWLDKAVQTLPNGSQTAVDVKASYWTNGEALLLFLAYPNFDGGSILHDPSVRFFEEASPVPTGGPLGEIPVEMVALVAVGIVAVAIIAIAAKRR